jgi:putative endonuclease
MPGNIELGRLGQQAAEEFLLGKGWRITERNFRAKTGEIDIIGRDGDYFVFVEVKCRSQLRFGYPRESVNNAKQRRIKKTAMFYISKNNLCNRDFRFDVVEVLKEQGSLHISHIENAFW